MSPRNTHSLLRNSGLTLIEIMVAMAIVGVIFAVSATSLRSAFGVNLRTTASKLAATLRYLSDKAVTEHLYIKVVYDLGAQTYTVEECTEPVLVSVEDEESEAAAEAKEEPAPEEGGAATEGEESEDGKKKQADSCAPSESSLLKPVKLPTGVQFKDVTLSYLKLKKERGKATTYFFPDGYATPTLINFKNDDDDDHYSVEVEALSGKVKIVGDYKEHFSEWGKEDGS